MARICKATRRSRLEKNHDGENKERSTSATELKKTEEKSKRLFIIFELNPAK